jgi:hypothetical protein
LLQQPQSLTTVVRALRKYRPYIDPLPVEPGSRLALHLWAIWKTVGYIWLVIAFSFIAWAIGTRGQWIIFTIWPPPWHSFF